MGHTLIYGGTFDPIHHGHLITCQRAREMVGADRVLFIPAWESPHKRGIRSASGEHRLKMVHLAIARNPFFVADGREILRGEEGGGPSYTVDTVESLRHEHPGERWTLLIGADQLAKFHTWHRVRELLEMLDVAVLGRVRSEGGNAVLEEGLAAVEKELGPEIAARLRTGVLRTPLVEVSATEIRDRVAAGLPISYLVPLGVADYIRNQGLYR